MSRFYYDLHIHSCLSPCGDEDNTPNNIVGMAKLCGLNVIALTDHNSCKNCPAFFKAAKTHGITPIAGMELTTSEDIHAVCLFMHLDDAMRFDKYVSDNRTIIKNKPEIFGQQSVLDEMDRPVCQVDELLINASFISISDAKELVESFGGVCYPAHIDREANGMIAVLGSISSDAPFDYYELHDRANIESFSALYNIPSDRFIVSSDAHYLTDMRDGENYFDLAEDISTDDEIRRAVFDILRRPRR